MKTHTAITVACMLFILSTFVAAPANALTPADKETLSSLTAGNNGKCCDSDGGNQCTWGPDLVPGVTCQTKYETHGGTRLARGCTNETNGEECTFYLEGPRKHAICKTCVSTSNCDLADTYCVKYGLSGVCVGDFTPGSQNVPCICDNHDNTSTSGTRKKCAQGDTLCP